MVKSQWSPWKRSILHNVEHYCFRDRRVPMFLRLTCVHGLRHLITTQKGIQNAHFLCNFIFMWNLHTGI